MAWLGINLKSLASNPRVSPPFHSFWIEINVVSCTPASRRSPNPSRYLTGSAGREGGGGGAVVIGRTGGVASLPQEKEIQRNVTGHLNGGRGGGRVGEGRWGEGGLIKSAAQTAEESSDLPNRVLYPPKY